MHSLFDYFVCKPSMNQWKNGFFLFSFCSITSACSINPNPEKSGFVDSIYHLSNNSYQQQKVKIEKALEQLMQQQTAQKKQLVILNKQLQQEQQESTKAKKKLQHIKQQQKESQQQLSAKNILYTANKNQHLRLQQQSKKLDEDIKQENGKARQQDKAIQALSSKRDALRKELFLQTLF
jgi:ribosome-binding ATPase YchF (GTP1/OBG family)